MTTNNTQHDLLDEIIVDNFAGGGGASTGIELATGRPVAIAVNHDPAAILMHKTNHPYTVHLQASVWDVDPVKECAGRKVGLAWFSPDCKHFSKAKGRTLRKRGVSADGRGRCPGESAGMVQTENHNHAAAGRPAGGIGEQHAHRTD